MDKVRKKNLQCLTRSKKRDKSKENDMFSNIPLELKIEILLKLPAKSIAKLSFVSKHWSLIISDKDFTERYLTQSYTRPRLLFTIVNPVGMHFLHSGSLEDLSIDHHRVTITPNPNIQYRFSPPIRGLICCTEGTKVLIGNPTTGQFVTLPKVKTRKSHVFSFFGYDHVNDLYKVLCMTSRVPYNGRVIKYIGTDEHQVFTLGAKQEWRMIKCKIRHRLPDYNPCKGICMNGVVYYLAEFNDELSQSLISFNLRSEDFDVIKLPKNVKREGSCHLVSYSGNIATLNMNVYSCDCKLYMWVLKDASKQEWSKTSLLLPSWEYLVGIEYDQWYGFRGTLITGELIFVPLSSPKPLFFICYDFKNNNARKFEIEGHGDYFDNNLSFFWEHVESPMFLPKVCSSHDY